MLVVLQRLARMSGGLEALEDLRLLLTAFDDPEALGELLLEGAELLQVLHQLGVNILTLNTCIVIRIKNQLLAGYVYVETI